MNDKIDMITSFPDDESSHLIVNILPLPLTEIPDGVIREMIDGYIKLMAESFNISRYL